MGPGDESSGVVPPLHLVADLGDRPLASELGTYLTALEYLWMAALAGEKQEARDLDWIYQNRSAALDVRKLRFGSPLEVAMTATAALTPLGIAGGVRLAWGTFERAIRLLMDWQIHRQDLRERRDHRDHPTPQDSLRLVGPVLGIRDPEHPVHGWVVPWLGQYRVERIERASDEDSGGDDENVKDPPPK